MNRGIHNFSAVSHSLVSYHFSIELQAGQTYPRILSLDPHSLVTADAVNKLDARVALCTRPVIRTCKIEIYEIYLI